MQLGGRNIAMGKFGDDELEAGNGAGGSAVRAFSVLVKTGLDDSSFTLQASSPGRRHFLGWLVDGLTLTARTLRLPPLVIS